MLQEIAPPQPPCRRRSHTRPKKPSRSNVFFQKYGFQVSGLLQLTSNGFMAAGSASMTHTASTPHMQAAHAAVAGHPANPMAMMLMLDAAMVWVLNAGQKFLFGHGKFKNTSIYADAIASSVAAVMLGSVGAMLGRPELVDAGAFYLGGGLVKGLLKEQEVAARGAAESKIEYAVACLKRKPMMAATLITTPGMIASHIGLWKTLPHEWALPVMICAWGGLACQAKSLGVKARQAEKVREDRIVSRLLKKHGGGRGIG